MDTGYPALIPDPTEGLQEVKEKKPKPGNPSEPNPSPTQGIEPLAPSPSGSNT